MLLELSYFQFKFLGYPLMIYKASEFIVRCNVIDDLGLLRNMIKDFKWQRVARSLKAQKPLAVLAES